MELATAKSFRCEISDDPGTQSYVGDSGVVNSFSRDDRELLSLGKRPVLRRNFGFMSILGFSCTVLITWEGIALIFSQGLENGGPAGVVWGFLVIWLGTLSVFTTISELASMAPTAAGQYHWVAMLASERWRSLCSYVTAWITICGWQALTASAAYLIGTLIESLAALTHPQYTPKPYQSMLFVWAIVSIAVFINTVASRLLAKFEGLILILHLFGFFAVLIPLLCFGKHHDASFVFTTFYNGGHWSTQTLSVFVGLPGSVFSLIGADSAVHMSEEIENAGIIVPASIIFSIVLNGILGFAMAIAIMFCMGSISDTLQAGQTYGFSIIGVFLNSTSSTTGSCLMGVVIAILGLCSTVGALAAASRMLWSFSRDRGLPLSKFLVFLDPRTSIPIVAVAATTFTSILLSLIVLGSPIVFNDLLSLTALGLYSSYFIVASLLLYRRITGGIAPYDADDLGLTTSKEKLHWGRWHVPEPFGTINNACACIFLLLVAFWSTWPPATPVYPSSMNYSVLVFGSVIIFSMLWWVFSARHYFKGPLVEDVIKARDH